MGELRLLRTFTGVLPEKIRLRAILKDDGKLYIVAKVNK